MTGEAPDTARQDEIGVSDRRVGRLAAIQRDGALWVRVEPVSILDAMEAELALDEGRDPPGWWCIARSKKPAEQTR